MAKQQTTKLTNQIIVRMDDQTKVAFMNRVKAEGKSASEVIMEWICSYLTVEPEATPDLVQMHTELQTLKEQVALIRNELMEKSAA